MKEERTNAVAAMMNELGITKSNTDELEDILRVQRIEDFLEGLDVSSIYDIGNDDLGFLYNIFFSDDNGDGIPFFGPYNIPNDAIITAMKTGVPLDIEQYRDKSIPDNAIF